MSANKTEAFAPLDEAAFSRASAVCLGAGRFLRAVLVPALQELGCDVVLAQPRGSSFGEYIALRIESGAGPSYEVDTVLTGGAVLTSTHQVAACGTLGTDAGRAAFMALPSTLHSRLHYIGVGVTEAGIAHNSGAMQALAEFLHAQHIACSHRGGGQPISVLCTDNVPLNGEAIRSHVLSCDFTQVCDQEGSRRRQRLGRGAKHRAGGLGAYVGTAISGFLCMASACEEVVVVVRDERPPARAPHPPVQLAPA
jgi:mannitol-1-phosphate/altronate dehydrogenase